MVTPGPRARVELVSAAWATIACALAAGGLFEPLLSDDAFYYFEIARNVARGEGHSFDSIAPTNGFHPLWTWALVPIYALLPDSPWLPIRIAIALSALCVAGTAVGIQRLLARGGAPRAGELAAYTWLFNPFTVVLAFRGMEAPLASLWLLLCVGCFARARRDGGWTRGDCALLGLSLGVYFLARTDAVLWAVVVGGFAARDLLQSGRARAIPSRVLVLGAAGGLVVLPWLAWNLHSFGTPLQTSGQAKLLFEVYGRLPPLFPPDAAGVELWLGLPLRVARNLLLALLVDFRFATGEEWTELRRSALLLLLAIGWALGVAALALRLRSRAIDDPVRRHARQLARPLVAPLALFVILHLCVYALLLRFYYSWYLLPVVLALCLIQGAAFAAAESLAPRRYARMALLQATALLAVSAFFCAPLFGRWPPERERAFADLGASLPSGTRVGLWNAGELGYFFSLHFPDLRVVNLDGLVNNELIRLARDGRYEEYVLGNIDVLVETPKPYLEQVVGRQRAARFVERHVRGPQRADTWPVFEVVR